MEVLANHGEKMNAFTHYRVVIITIDKNHILREHAYL